MYSVKHAAALTGLSVDTLRMWERRYGVVEPARSEGGYRLYDEAAIVRLTAMRALVEAGWAPRAAARQVTSGTTLGPGPTTPAEPDTSAGGDDLDQLVRLARDFDGEALTATLDEAFAGADLETMVDAWLMPALLRLGAAWQRGEVSVAAEHFASAGVHRRLARALDAVPPPSSGAPRVLVGLPRGSRHELGVLAFAVMLARAGLDVVYVGADIPPDSWVVALMGSSPQAVAIGVPSLEDVPAVRDTVAAVSAARPGLPVLLGGRFQDDVGVGQPLGHSLPAAAREVAQLLTE